jgi:hypothetical protein
VLSVEAIDCLLSDATFCIDREDLLLEWILGLSADYLPLLSRVQWSGLTANLVSAFERAALVEPQESVWAEVSRLLRQSVFAGCAGFSSLIVADFPALFAGLGGKRFTLLWRGSRDGFGADDFHGRCDGHANTLTFIEDTEGNIFGGFTPVQWHSPPTTRYEADPDRRSFLFTLKNPHNVTGLAFALNAEEKDTAIMCDSSWGPHFRDIGVSHNCNANTISYTTGFGHTYANDTGMDGETFFTGSEDFTVKEIEVLEITY